MSLWHEMESMCSTAKHVPENIDPTELRQLLRRCQSMVEALEPMLNPQTLLIEREDDQYVVAISATYSSAQRDNLVYWLADIDA